MKLPLVLFAFAAACSIVGGALAQPFHIDATTFSSAGGAPAGQTLALGMTLGQSVAGLGAGIASSHDKEGAGFWHWGSQQVLDVPAPTPRGEGVVLTYALYPNSPNPFSTRTLIRYAIPSGVGAVPVQLRIYDLSGRLVRTLDSGWRSGGLHALPWDGRDKAGHALGGGIYFCRVTAGSFAATRRLVLAR